MNLEVGMYVRTPKGIAKIEEITKDRTEIYFNCDTGLSISFIRKDFTEEEMAQTYKHSHNIIDLIEEEDYVNGYKVYEIVGGYACLVNNTSYPLIDGSEIKSIVTKEQFESMSYSLEG